MPYSKKERAQYNESRKRVAEKMGLDKHGYNYYRRVANKLSEADTAYANGYRGRDAVWQGNDLKNRYEDKEHGKDVNEAFKKAGAYRKKKGHKIHFYHQTDPRGASLRIGKERMSQKDYDRKGEAVY